MDWGRACWLGSSLHLRIGSSTEQFADAGDGLPPSVVPLEVLRLIIEEL